MMIRYVDPYQNIFWFESEKSNTRYGDLDFWFGTVLKHRPGYHDNVHGWKLGSYISVTKCVCVVEPDIFTIEQAYDLLRMIHSKQKEYENMQNMQSCLA